jgi:Uma2 family endonuclease
MSVDISEIARPRPKPPFYGPDNRYLPPAENGELPFHLPDHLELPYENGEIVENFRENPQGEILNQAIRPIIDQLHPNGDYTLGHDCGIYWRLTDPRVKGAVCPDWFYVPGVPAELDGEIRRSYVLWKEHVPPAVMIEYASDDGSKERDQTPYEGKFWIYEQAVRGRYYAIFVVETGELEVHRLEGSAYRRLEPNERGHYLIEPLGVALGVWRGSFGNQTAPWLRWYDARGNMLPTAEERAEAADQRADKERQRAENLAAKLRALGIDLNGN